MSVDTGMEYDGNQVVSWAACAWRPCSMRTLNLVMRFSNLVCKGLDERPKLPAGVEVLSIKEHNHYKALGQDYRYKKWANKHGWLYW